MSAPKCSFTVFGNGPFRDKKELDLRLSGERIPYNPNPKLLLAILDCDECDA